MLTVPVSLIELRSDLCTIVNEIAALEQMAAKEQWTGVARAHEKQVRAYRKIEQRAVQACERIGVTATERQAWKERERQLLEVNDAQRLELARRAHTIDILTRDQGT